jgi:hypothetical protein
MTFIPDQDLINELLKIGMKKISITVMDEIIKNEGTIEEKRKRANEYFYLTEIALIKIGVLEKENSLEFRQWFYDHYRNKKMKKIVKLVLEK